MRSISTPCRAAALLALASCSAPTESSPPRPAVEAVAVAPAIYRGGASFGKEGFRVVEEAGRLLVFREGSPELARYRETGRLEDYVVRPDSGPGGRAVRGPDPETLLAYLADRPGFETFVRGERVWVFEEGSPALPGFRATGRLEESVFRPAAGPLGTTLEAPDLATIARYRAWKPGFTAVPTDGALWVFRERSDALQEFLREGDVEGAVEYEGGGPAGRSILAPDARTCFAYCVAAPGFVTFVRDGVVWVFGPQTGALERFLEEGEAISHATRIEAGPFGATVKGPDLATVDAYLRANRAFGA